MNEELRKLLAPILVAADEADKRVKEMPNLSGEASTGLKLKFKHLWAIRDYILNMEKGE